MSVISLSAYREANQPHLSGNCRCMQCTHEWVGVAPVGTTWMDCPECKSTKGHFTKPIARGVEMWTCGCGNQLFHVNREGLYCTMCGEWQVFP